MKNAFIHPNRLEFTVTWHCSGRCRHCSVGDPAAHAGQARHVDGAAAARAIEWTAAHYDLRSVMTFGGEPLLYPEETCAIHAAAARCGVAARQLITNGYFSKDPQRIDEVARMLAEAGVNELLLSVDAFHQETIPAEPVMHFARAVQSAGIPRVRLQPAWVVNERHDNPWNARTREVLAAFAPLGLEVSEGNDIFLAGRAKEQLAAYYPPLALDMNQRCGDMPYTEPPTDVRCLAVEPTGDVIVCNQAIGNIGCEDVGSVIARYDPAAWPALQAAADGAAGLLALAERMGLGVSGEGCASVCELCKRVSEKLRA